MVPEPSSTRVTMKAMLPISCVLSATGRDRGETASKKRTDLIVVGFIPLVGAPLLERILRADPRLPLLDFARRVAPWSLRLRIAEWRSGPDLRYPQHPGTHPHEGSLP